MMGKLTDQEIMNMYADVYGDVNQILDNMSSSSPEKLSDVVKGFRTTLSERGYFKDDHKRSGSKVEKFVRRKIGTQSRSEQFDDIEELVEEKTEVFNTHLQSMISHIRDMTERIFERFLKNHQIDPAMMSYQDKEKAFDSFILNNPDSKPIYFNVMKNTLALVEALEKHRREEVAGP